MILFFISYQLNTYKKHESNKKTVRLTESKKSLNAHSKVGNNFWQLKPFKNDEK